MNTFRPNMRALYFLLLFVALGFFAKAQIPTDSLYFYASFNKSLKDSVGGLTGSHNGSYLTQDRFINDSASVYVDGVNDWVNFGTTSYLRDIDQFTVSTWVQPEDINYSRSGGPKSGRYTIMGNAGGGYGFRFFQYKDELHFTVASITGTDSCGFTLSTSQKNDWIHLVGVSDSGYLSIYANGALAKKVKAQNSIRKLPRENFEIGRGTLNNKGYWEGRVDELRMYNRVLSDKEIKGLYQAELWYSCFNTINDTTFYYDSSTVQVKDTVTTTIVKLDSIFHFDTTTVIQYDTTITVISLFDTTVIIDSVVINDIDTLSIEVKETKTIPVYDTVYFYTYDTAVIRVDINDTIFVEDTLNIYYATSLRQRSSAKINIYPNPAKEVITIDLGDFSEFEGWQFYITNTLGQTVWQNASNARSFTLNVADLNGKGLFHINIYNKEKGLLERRALVVY